MRRAFDSHLPLIALVAILALCLPAAASAQWTSDPADNLVVSDLAGGSTQPQMVPTPDGGFYVSWLDNIGNGFDVRLQRLDAGGNALWPHNGILVADRSYSSTYDYGLAIDADGNAVLGFNCCESGATEHIVASKVLADGTLAWGADGIDVSGSAEGVYNAYVSAAGDAIVVAWSADGGVRAQKLAGDGSLQWIAGGVLVDQPAGFKLLGGVQGDADGNAIVSWSNQTGPTRILTAQKLAGVDGAPLWNGGSGLRVFGEGNLQAGYYPPFMADGAGGGVFFDYDNSGGIWVPRAQRIDADGNLLFGANGVLGTTATAHDHVGTAAAFDPATGDVYLVWKETWTENFQSWDGVSAQRIDAAGQRAWGDSGKVLVPAAISTDGTHVISQLVALPATDGFVASWVTGAVPAPDQPLHASRLDAAGNATWAAAPIAVKTTRATGRSVGAVSTEGYFAWAWLDGEDGDAASTIRAQNLNADGSLGIDDTIFTNGFEE